MTFIPELVELPINAVLTKEKDMFEDGLIKESGVGKEKTMAKFQYSSILGYYSYKGGDGKEYVNIERPSGDEIMVLLSMYEFEKVYKEATMRYMSKLKQLFNANLVGVSN